MEIKAQLKFLKISPRKVRAVLDQVRYLSIAQIEAQLLISKKRAAKPILKLFLSALANAQNSYSFRKEDLLLKRIEANEGPTLHRWFPRAFGRAAPIRKRSTHLTIILEPKKGAAPIKKTSGRQETKKEKVEEIKKITDYEKDKKINKQKTENKKEKSERSKGPRKGFMKKIFSRKSI